jgi:hypothetical protein
MAGSSALAVQGMKRTYAGAVDAAGRAAQRNPNVSPGIANVSPEIVGLTFGFAS